MPDNEKPTRPRLFLLPSEGDGSERTYTINITTLAVDGNEAHDLAHAVLERVADLPGLLSMSTTVSFEEPVNRILIKNKPGDVAPGLRRCQL